jgi:hypothetical protein
MSDKVRDKSRGTGIGPSRLKQYGKRLLQMVRD